MNRNTDLPKIGIYVPTYNRGKYIKETIDSLLAQTYGNFTVTIVDNTSTDNTEEVVKSYSDDRVRYIRNEKNIGAVGNINRCFDMANEDYVCIYHSDDVYMPQILEKEINFLMEYEAKVVFTDRYLIDGESVLMESESNPFLKKNTLVDYESLLLEIINNGTPLTCPTFMCKKEIIDEFKGFDPEYEFTGDTELYLRIARKYKVGIVSEKLIKYRIHKGQETNRYLNSPELQEEFKVLNKELDYYEKVLGKKLDKETAEYYYTKLSAEYTRVAKNIILVKETSEENQSEAKSYIDKALKLKRFPITTKVGITQVLLKLGIYKRIYKLLK